MKLNTLLEIECYNFYLISIAAQHSWILLIIKPFNYYPRKYVAFKYNKVCICWLSFCKFNKFTKSPVTDSGTPCYDVVHHPLSIILLLYMWCLGKSSNNPYFLCVKYMAKLCLIFSPITNSLVMIMPYLTRFKLRKSNVQSLVLMYRKNVIFMSFLYWKA